MSDTRFAFLLALVLVLPATRASATTPVPAVTGPIPGAGFVASTSIDLAALGYAEEEYFVAGTATGFTSPSPLGSDGAWSATPGNTAPYRTRILVRRPADAKRFNGTVVVEWLNVSGGLDAAPDWIFAHTLLMREGFAWVGVSAQFTGIEGGASPIGLNLSLKAINPARYGTLSHPGDSFSYDMFSQVGAALRDTTGVRPLATLSPRRVIAVGESQSAFRLVTYVNAIHPLAKVYDGFLIHSRSGGAAALSQSPEPAVPGPTPAFIRTDLDVPVLTFETETDLVALGFQPARQADTRRVRLWEVAGTAHGDTYQLAEGMTDPGPAARDTTYLPPNASPIPGIITCASPVNAGPHHYVLSAAIRALDRWVRSGRPPRTAPRLVMSDSATPAFVLDARGNVRGGIRTPQLDVPVATLSGLGQAGGGFCGLFGTTLPFDAATLESLYPTHTAYVAAVTRALRKAVQRGWILRTDAKAIKASAIASGVGT
ncbi:MAG: alpha/beta hydrolase domain-containing protein [Candidatus Binatia bacterium]